MDRITKKDFIGKDLSNSNFTRANLSNSLFIEADINNSNFRNSNIEGSHFLKSNLKNSNFYGADMRNSDLSRSDLAGAIFRGTNLRNTIIQNVVIDEDTEVEFTYPIGEFEVYSNLYGKDIKLMTIKRKLKDVV